MESELFLSVEELAKLTELRVKDIMLGIQFSEVGEKNLIKKNVDYFIQKDGYCLLGIGALLYLVQIGLFNEYDSLKKILSSFFRSEQKTDIMKLKRDICSILDKYKDDTLNSEGEVTAVNDKFTFEDIPEKNTKFQQTDELVPKCEGNTLEWIKKNQEKVNELREIHVFEKNHINMSVVFKKIYSEMKKEYQVDFEAYRKELLKKWRLPEETKISKLRITAEFPELRDMYTNLFDDMIKKFIH